MKQPETTAPDARPGARKEPANPSEPPVTEKPQEIDFDIIRFQNQSNKSPDDFE